MAHNKELAKQQGISQEACIAIDEMHKMREQIMARPNMFFESTEEAVEALHGIAFALQWLWGFPLNKKMHKDVEDFESSKLGWGVNLSAKARGKFLQSLKM